MQMHHEKSGGWNMPADYKQSCFNFLYKRAENENVIYNTFSKALVVFTDDEISDFFNGKYSKKDKQVLIDNGMLVESDFDEIRFLKYVHYKTKFAKDTLFLTIAPTLDCNFACPYCYENRRAGKMSKEVQDAICDFVEQSVLHGTDTVDISWYGGEPLLYFDIVEYLSCRLKEICSYHKKTLKMHMVTNGYLLTQKIVDRLDELGVTRIQITLDGLPEHHDKTRPLRNGSGTFEKIFTNLHLFDDSPIAVVIRMNVDNNNRSDYGELKKRIDEIGNPNIDIYVSPTEDINKDKENHVSDFMSNEQFESFAIKTCEDGGATTNDFSVMDDRYCFCTAETENCFVVDDQGDCYKCWDEVGRKQYRCFNILDLDDRNESQISCFVASDPFSYEECSKCAFLPLCFGGCKFQRAHLNKSVCGFTEQSLRQYLESVFFK